MEEQRQAVVEHILEVSRQLFHRSLQLGGDRHWAEVDLTMHQLQALLVVASLGRATMSQLARTVGMTLSTATGVADRLVAQRLVRRVNDPDDRRLVWLYPTEQATTLVDRLNHFSEAHLRLITRHLALEDLSLVARAQDLLYEAMLKVTGEELAASGLVEPNGPRSA